MSEVYFYHLTQRPLEVALRQILERALKAEWRVAVRGREAETLDRLDRALWTGPDDGFLPHGRAGGPHDALQPVLLTEAATLDHPADFLVSIDGAPLTAEEVARCTRAAVLFDGADGAALQTARGQWRALTAAGCPAQYWSEESGSWQMKARHPA